MASRLAAAEIDTVVKKNPPGKRSTKQCGSDFSRDSLDHNRG
jgi:hypothetical protein